jgi:protein-S-isoprenylcysteine O-methyltransferase Ste14
MSEGFIAFLVGTLIYFISCIVSEARGTRNFQYVGFILDMLVCSLCWETAETDLEILSLVVLLFGQLAGAFFFARFVYSAYLNVTNTKKFEEYRERIKKGW